jgi:hypothetical protein
MISENQPNFTFNFGSDAELESARSLLPPVDRKVMDAYVDLLDLQRQIKVAKEAAASLPWLEAEYQRVRTETVELAREFIKREEANDTKK